MREGGQKLKDIFPCWAVSHMFELLAAMTAVDDVKLTNILIGLALDHVAGRLWVTFLKELVMIVIGNTFKSWKRFSFLS